jgi:hypothetical protein
MAAADFIGAPGDHRPPFQVEAASWGGHETQGDTERYGRMIANTFEPTFELISTHPSLRFDDRVLTLLILRHIEAEGPLAGLDAANAVAPLARLLGIAPPGYALLHDLTAAGLLQSPDGRQRRYSITDAGSREADRLARECWPQLHEFVAGLKRRLAPASPRFGPEPRFVSEWSDSPAESRSAGS